MLAACALFDKADFDPKNAVIGLKNKCFLNDYC